MSRTSAAEWDRMMCKRLRGELGASRTCPASLDLPERASLALEHLLELADPDYGDLPFGEVLLGNRPQCFRHAEGDWTGTLAWSILGMAAGRWITGSLGGLEVESNQRHLLLRSFDNLDGFSYSARSPWNDRGFGLLEQSRVLLALLVWCSEYPCERLERYAARLLDALWRISEPYGKGGRRLVIPDAGCSDDPGLPKGLPPVGAEGLPSGALQGLPSGLLPGFSPGHSSGLLVGAAFIEPLVKHHELTGSGLGLELAENLARSVFDPASGVFGEDGSFSEPFGQAFPAVTGLSRLAAVIGDTLHRDRALQVHRWAAGLLTSYGTALGSGPGEEAADPWGLSELIRSSISLAEAGWSEGWDEVDRFVRNQLVEMQFTDLWNVEVEPRSHLETKPFDDCEDIMKRSLGAFFPAFPNRADYARTTARSTGAALWALGDVWRHIVVMREGESGSRAEHPAVRAIGREGESGTNRGDASAASEGQSELIVNLGINFENRWARVTGHEPYRGRIEVVSKIGGTLRVRLPRWVPLDRVIASVDGNERVPFIEEGMVCLGGIDAGQVVAVDYPLRQDTTEEPVRRPGRRQPEVPGGRPGPLPEQVYRACWRSNTVVGISPQYGGFSATYRRGHLEQDTAPQHEVCYFIPEGDLDP